MSSANRAVAGNGLGGWSTFAYVSSTELASFNRNVVRADSQKEYAVVIWGRIAAQPLGTRAHAYDAIPVLAFAPANVAEAFVHAAPQP
jgi:hypothetical protein